MAAIIEAASCSKPSLWIVGRRYDVAFIFGGAAASLLVPFLVRWKPGLLPILFWGWLFLFDGTHIWAAYSRTYIDRKYWRTDRRLLLGSLLWFFLPVLAIGFMWLLGSMDPVNLFLLFAMVWSYHHIVRQHYGYISLYDRKAKTDVPAHRVNKWTLYVGLWAPYLYFLMAHPINRTTAQFPPLKTRVSLGLLGAAVAVSGVVLLCFIAYHFLRRHSRAGRSVSPAVFFVTVCLVVYSVIFYVISRHEPLLPGARTVVQSFMLVQIMVTLFHNIQYHAIVWHYNRRKYPGRQPEHGWATRLNRNLAVYFLVGILFSVGYIATAWFTSEYPSYRGEVLEPVFVPLAFCLWWGLALHHYYLDQKIWRVSKTRDLQEQLAIAI